MFIHALLFYGTTKRPSNYIKKCIYIFKNEIAQYTIHFLVCVLGLYYEIHIYSSSEEDVLVSFKFFFWRMHPFNFYVSEDLTKLELTFFALSKRVTQKLILD